MSYHKKDSNDGVSGNKAAGKSSVTTGSQQKNVGFGVSKNQVLTDDMKIHEWLKTSCKRIAIVDYEAWTCLFDPGRTLPVAKTLQEFADEAFAREGIDPDELDSDDEAAPPARDAAQSTPARTMGTSSAPQETSTPQAPTVPAPQPQELDVEATIQAFETNGMNLKDMKKSQLREIIRAYAVKRTVKMTDKKRKKHLKRYIVPNIYKQASVEASRANQKIEDQMKAIFLDLWYNIHVDIQERMKISPSWNDTWDNRDVIRLLNLVDLHHGKLSPEINENLAEARRKSNDAINSLKMKAHQTLAEFKDDVLSAYAKRARYNYPGEPLAPESDKIETFMQGLTFKYQRYKHYYRDLNDYELPKTLEDVAQAVLVYMSKHDDLYKEPRGQRMANQLAIHKVEKKKDESSATGGDNSGEKKIRVPKPTDKCGGCGGKGHWKRDCPTVHGKTPAVAAVPETKINSVVVIDDGVKEEVVVIDDEEYDVPMREDEEVIVIDYTANKQAPLGTSKSTWINLDNCAEGSVFCNADLLTDVREGKVVILDTIAGKKSINQWGKFGPIDVMIDPDGKTNLLSQDDLERVSESVETVHGKKVTACLKRSGVIWEFHKLKRGEFGQRNKFYVMVPSAIEVYLSTVRDREAKFTKDEVARAKGARELKMRLGGASDRDMIQFLLSGVAVGCPYTAADVRRATLIYGPDIAGLKGKTTASGPKKAHILDLEDIGEVKRQSLFVDIFEVEAQPFILAVMKPLNYRFCSILEGKTAKHIHSALGSILDMISSKGFEIKRIEIDPERGLVAIKDQLGVDIAVTGAGSHVAVAERGGRVVKERCRLILSALPFPLAARFTRYLVMFVVTRLNLMPKPGDGSNLCPRERFTGRKLMFKRELEVGFGDYAEIWSKPNQSNSMEPRTISAIALCPVGNDEGSWYFYDIMECTVVQRSQWKILPMPDIVIKILNELARNDLSALGKGVPVPMSRGTPMVGEIPADRMIVDPRLDVPRFGPDGERLGVTIKPKRNRKKAAVQVVTDGVATVAPAVTNVPLDDPEDVDVGVVAEDEIVAEEDDPPEEVQIGGDVIPDEPGELYVPQLFEEVEQIVEDTVEEDPLTKDDSDDDDGELGSRLEDGVRKSVRLAKRKTMLMIKVYQMSVKESVAKLGEGVHDALRKEFKKMDEMDVFKFLRYKDLNEEQRKKIIHSSAVIKEKTDVNGLVTSIKGRWVASGNQMNKELYESGSSPTVSTEGVFMQFALCAGANQIWSTIDIGSAYLHSEMTEFVAVYIAPGLVRYVIDVMPHAAEFVDDRGRLLVQLKKALYGCVQSSRLWYEHMDKVLKEIGFRANGYDSCIYHKGEVGKQITICLHVDDLFVASDTQELMNELYDHLKKSFREVKINEGSVNAYLGMRIRDTEDGIEVDMITYIDECLEWSKVTGVAITPASANLFEVSDGDPLLEEDKQEDFHTGVAKLLYLAKRARPDILPAVSFLTSRVGKVTEKDVFKLQRVFKFLRYSRDKVMRFKKGVEVPELFAYVDAGYGIHTEGESRSGLVVTLNGTPVIWKTSKQSIVTKSSTEAELVALSDGSTDILWARELLISQGYEMGAIDVGEDNQSVLVMLEKRRFGNARTKHINIRYFFVVDRIKSGELKMVYVPTDLMVADFMTKPLTGSQFIVLQDRLLGLSSARTKDKPVA